MRAAEQKIGFDLVGRLNKLKAAEYPGDSSLDARIKSYELAFRMQKSLPEVLNFAKETEETKKLYGIDRPGDARLRHADARVPGGWSNAACASSRCSTAPAAPACGTRMAA